MLAYFRWCFVLHCLLATAFLFGSQDVVLEHATLSIYAVRTDTGQVLIDENSDKSLIPASCVKVITTAAALHLLGPESRFETYLEYDGIIDQEKTLHGNLYIRGTGDPCLGSNRISSSLDWNEQIQVWVEAVQKLGIQRIEGSVIGDATRWEKALAVPSWAWEDLGNYYGAGACALSFHENAYALFFSPGDAVGQNARLLRTDPFIPMLHFQNEVMTGPVGSGDRACIYGSEFSPTQYVRGTIPAGVNEFAIQGAIPDPAAFCADLLTCALEKHGIEILHQKRAHVSKKEIFHTTYSPSVKEIVHWTNQKSINLYAEHLLKKMGEKMYNEGSTQAGIKAVTAFWDSQKIDLAGFNMVDGSGLSRKNLVTAKQFVCILQQMKKSDLFPIFFESLPQQVNIIKAKSGSMSLINGYVGYSGNIAFAILVNQCMDQKQMHEKIKSILNNLDQLSQKSKE